MEQNWKYIKCGWGYDTGGFNYARYCNMDDDTLWQQGLAEPDAAKRKGIYDQVTTKLADMPPQATLSRASVLYVWN